MPDAPGTAAHDDSPVLLRLARRLEDSPALDGLSGTVRGVALALVPSHGRLREELHGRTLGDAGQGQLVQLFQHPFRRASVGQRQRVFGAEPAIGRTRGARGGGRRSG